MFFVSSKKQGLFVTYSLCNIQCKTRIHKHITQEQQRIICDKASVEPGLSNQGITTA